MKKIENFDFNSIRAADILFASTSNLDYEMSRVILVENKNGGFLVLDGAHCSCYEFEDTEWEAIHYTEEELKKLANVWAKGLVGVEVDPEQELGVFLKRYLSI